MTKKVDIELLRNALQGMVDSFKPFTLKPLGAPGSAARAEQDAQRAAYSDAVYALERTRWPVWTK